MRGGANSLSGAGISARSTALAIVAAAALVLAACGGSPVQTGSAAGRASSQPASSASPAEPASAGSPSAGSPSAGSPSAGSPAAGSLTAAPTQLPAYQALSWVAQAPSSVLTVTGHNIELNECASVDSPTTWEQQGYTSSSGDSAILETYTFTSAALASAAETGVVAGMDNCQATSRALQAANNVTPDAVCSQTAQTGDAAAFERTWTGVPGVSAGGPQINHLYVAVSGTIMLVLHFNQLNTTSSSAAIYNVRGDPGVLTMLTNLLTANSAGS